MGLSWCRNQPDPIRERSLRLVSHASIRSFLESISGGYTDGRVTAAANGGSCGRTGDLLKNNQLRRCANPHCHNERA